MVWSRSKQDTLVLPVSALALLILGDYKATSGWNWHNWMLCWVSGVPGDQVSVCPRHALSEVEQLGSNILRDV